MRERIENEVLCVEIDTRGAEMQSIRTADGTEYLWQGDSNTWSDKAINLFPYIARLTEGSYHYKGETYRMDPHGFVWKSELSAKRESASKMSFMLEANEETRKEYPFAFTYACDYELVKNEIRITYRVTNQDDKTMYFGIGGHPGFQVPIGGAGEFSDYYLEFAEKAEPYRIGMSQSCFVTGEDKVFLLDEEKRLHLYHEMFDEDAIILRDMCKSVSLRSTKTERRVTVTYPQMNYLGIWHWPGAEVKYICIEPWSSLPSREGKIEELEQQENLVSLNPKEVYQNQWKITIES